MPFWRGGPYSQSTGYRRRRTTTRRGAVPRRRPRFWRSTRAASRFAPVPYHEYGPFRQVSPYHGRIGFPKTATVRLRFAREITLDAALGSFATHVFRANTCWDPDVSGTGHQPLGFDQWMTFYDHFTVVGSICTATFLSSSTGSVQPAYGGVLLTDNALSVAGKSNAEHLLESAQLDTPEPLIVGGNVDGASGRAATTRVFFDARRFFNVKDVVGSADYRGDAGGDSNEQAFFEVFTYSIKGRDPGIIDVTVVIDYLVVFTEPRGLSQS